MKHGTTSVKRERGFGVVLMLAFVLVLGATTLGLAIYNPRAANSAAVDDPVTADALAAAKAALIGYAVHRGGPVGTARPAELPCPDMDNDGWEDATCVTAGGRFAIGRLPWRTLGIPEPKDSAGETLWYAVANALRPRASNNNDVNSNTRGNLEVRAADGITTRTNEAAAVIFAPGQALGTQNRNSAQTAACAATNPANAVIARSLCASNYLETASGVNNATANSAFVTGAPSNAYNDRLIYLEVSEYLPAVEMRIGAELRSLLLAYRQKSVCQCFPWADSWAYSGGIADNGVNRGRFPSRPYPENWGQGTIPALPQWVADNDWHNLMFYSASRIDTDGGGALCVFCSASASITVDGAPVSALFFTPGPPPAGVNRAAGPAIDVLGNYLEDGGNNDKAACPGTNAEHANGVPIPPVLVPASCDTYVRPTSTARTRDRIFMISVPSCAMSAAALAQEAVTTPCHTTGSGVRPICQTHVDALAMCSCSTAAQAMITEPCRNSLNPGSCRKALADLSVCGL